MRGLKILGFFEEKTPDGYSPLKMTAPLLGSKVCDRLESNPVATSSIIHLHFPFIKATHVLKLWTKKFIAFLDLAGISPWDAASGG